MNRNFSCFFLFQYLINQSVRAESGALEYVDLIIRANKILGVFKILVFLLINKLKTMKSLWNMTLKKAFICDELKISPFEVILLFLKH